MYHMDTFIQHGGVSSNLPIQTVTDRHILVWALILQTITLYAKYAV